MRNVFTFIVAAVLTGCAVGPNYCSPQSVWPTAYSHTSVEVIEVMPPAVQTEMTKDLKKSDGIKMISTDELINLTFAGLKSGRLEILPG